MHPFRDGDATATFRNHQQTVVEQINGLDNEYVSIVCDVIVESFREFRLRTVNDMRRRIFATAFSALRPQVGLGVAIDLHFSLISKG